AAHFASAPPRCSLAKNDEREDAVEPPRRAVLRLAAGAASGAAAPRLARAEPHPTRPVRLIVPFAPGGGTDLCAHLLGEWLARRVRPPVPLLHPDRTARPLRPP